MGTAANRFTDARSSVPRRRGVRVIRRLGPLVARALARSSGLSAHRQGNRYAVPRFRFRLLPSRVAPVATDTRPKVCPEPSAP